MPIEWNDAAVHFLITERRCCNTEYHRMRGRSKAPFWESVSRRIRRTYRLRYTARQCEQKWRNLVRDYTVSKILITMNNR